MFLRNILIFQIYIKQIAKYTCNNTLSKPFVFIKYIYNRICSNQCIELYYLFTKISMTLTKRDKTVRILWNDNKDNVTCLYQPPIFPDTGIKNFIYTHPKLLTHWIKFNSFANIYHRHSFSCKEIKNPFLTPWHDILPFSRTLISYKYILWLL